jgi:hypothetical protein
LKKSILFQAAKTEEAPTGTIERAEGGYSQAKLNTPFEGLLAKSLGHKIFSVEIKRKFVNTMFYFMSIK